MRLYKVIQGTVQDIDGVLYGPDQEKDTVAEDKLGDCPDRIAKNIEQLIADRFIEQVADVPTKQEGKAKKEDETAKGKKHPDR